VARRVNASARVDLQALLFFLGRTRMQHVVGLPALAGAVTADVAATPSLGQNFAALTC
jgi:hypothetical protein